MFKSYYSGRKIFTPVEYFLDIGISHGGLSKKRKSWKICPPDRRG
jgi:hypothetical protein